MGTGGADGRRENASRAFPEVALTTLVGGAEKNQEAERRWLI